MAIKIEKIEQQGYGKKATLSNGHSHWIPDGNWQTKEEFENQILNVEKQTFGNKQEKENLLSLVGKELKGC